MNPTQAPRNPAFHALLDTVTIQFPRILREIADLHERKSHDYAKDSDVLSNFRRCERIGVPAFTGVMVRLSDKQARIEQILSGKEPKNESLRDSLVDQAVYSLIAVILLDLASSKTNTSVSAEPTPPQR